jgi:hypothetical protein
MPLIHNDPEHWLRAPADRDQLFRMIATTHSN